MTKVCKRKVLPYDEKGIEILKRLLACAAALVMILSLATAALAEETAATEETPEAIAVPEATEEPAPAADKEDKAAFSPLYALRDDAPELTSEGFCRKTPIRPTIW